MQQTPLVGIGEGFGSLKENSTYLEAAKNGAVLCGIKDGVMKWMSLKEGSLGIFLVRGNLIGDLGEGGFI